MSHYRAGGKDLVLRPKFLSDLSMCRSSRGVSMLANTSGSQLHTAGMVVRKMKPSFFLPDMEALGHGPAQHPGPYTLLILSAKTRLSEIEE